VQVVLVLALPDRVSIAIVEDLPYLGAQRGG
jgi:hypothetical protein